MSTSLPLAALNMALLERRPPPGLIHHTDRGSQYASKEYRQALQAAGILCSMSSKGDCWDNVPGESIFSRIKDDLGYRTKFESRMQSAVGIEDYIETFHNPERRHFSVGFMSPDDYEKAEQLETKKP